MSQRSAKVEKDVLTQASLLFLHKVVHPIDLRVYKDLVPLPSTQVEDMVRRLRAGEAIVIYNHEVNVLQLRLRHTFHVGSTPTWSRVAQPKLRKLDAGMLKELRALTVGTDRKASSTSEQTKFAAKVKELEEAIASKDAEIQRLQNQVDLLSKFSFSIEGLSYTPNLSGTETLKVNQAIVGRVITGEVSNDEAASTTVTAISRLPEPYVEVSLTQVEQRKLDSIIQRFQKLSKLQRSILRLLFEHEGTAMTVPMMASWLSLKESTIRSRPPHDLIRMKLVTRKHSRSGYRYMSLVSTYLKNEFPDTNPDLLSKLIFR